MTQRRMKYNPAFLTEEELVDSFVVRHADLDLITRVVRDNATKSNQHILVIGPRGIGKTTLVLRAVAEVRRTPELDARWYPIVFAEESYQVATPGEFWLEALFHLGQQTKDPRWERAHRELSEETDEGRLRERALAQLMDFADSVGKRILLVVENLNMLLGDQVSDADAWVLRHTLLNEPRLMLLASATRRFEEVENGGKAMFDLFRTHELKPLTAEESSEVWNAITGQNVSETRIRPIQILTGGSPRLLAIIASFGAHLSLRELMTDLTRLVDEHTEYFRSHLDALAPTERKVYLALTELWEPSTARDVAQAARLDVSKTSAFLNRLVERGAVVVTDQQGRKKWYQVAERMYNIYCLLRRKGGATSRLRAVVGFMAAMYQAAEPEQLASRDMVREAVGAYGKEAGLSGTEPGGVIEFITGMAAAGHAREALELVRNSPSAALLEPLAIGLKLYLGAEVKAPVEIVEVARDVVKRIEERRCQLTDKRE
jgi:DNA polymerase III delta prime subunit